MRLDEFGARDLAFEQLVEPAGVVLERSHTHSYSIEIARVHQLVRAFEYLELETVQNWGMRFVVQIELDFFIKKENQIKNKIFSLSSLFVKKLS